MGKKNREWGQHDAAMWHTCRMAYDLETTGQTNPLSAATLFPLSTGETALASGELFVEEFRSDGDGSYQRSNLIAGGTGLFGAAMLAGTITGSAIGNARRRSRAAQDALQTWRFQTHGQITVTTHAFYIQDTAGLWRWDWDSIDQMQVLSFNSVLMQGQSTRGPVTWRLSSHWSELAFVCWARARHRQHPQYLSGGWVPPGWVPWATAQGYPTQFGQNKATTRDIGPS